MDILIDADEARVIGCLIEKQLSTPEYYPLSLNALTNACNQKTNRDPVTSYDEAKVEEILDGLLKKKLVNKSMVGRVPKFEELLIGQLNLVPRESAVVCALLLRGPQTAGELRGRTSRLHAFESLEAVLETLTQLEEMGLAKRLSRLPGHKESRYGHLLCGPAEGDITGGLSDGVADGGEKRTEPDRDSHSDRLERIEAALVDLQAEFSALKQQFETFKKQFE